MQDLGCRILESAPLADAALVAGFAELPVPNISDVANRLYGTSALRPYHAGGAMAGQALTVRTRPGDNLMLHKALDIARPGEVVVVDGGGDLANAQLGELMYRYAVAKGLAGIVIDGAIRDIDHIGRGRLPIFARGVSPRGPYKDGPGEINVPVVIDGMPVLPGQIVVGDVDGVIAFDVAFAPRLLELARAKQTQEDETKAAIREGAYDRRWIDPALARKGIGRAS